MVTRGKATDLELAYVAGVVDSDGHIGIDINSNNPQRRRSVRYEATISVLNTDRPLVDWLQSLFGGSIHQRRQLLPHHKPTYSFKVCERQAAEMARVIAPYLRIKQRQALLLLELKDQQVGPAVRGQGARLPESEVQRRETIWLRFKALNDDRGRHPQRLSEKAPGTGEAIV